MEMLVAAVLLVTGVLGTFSLVDTANRNASANASREGAANLAREILEAAHEKPFAQIGTSNWIQAQLAALPSGSGSAAAPNGYTNTTSVTRRATTYSVTVTWCAVDDGRDGNGAHDASVHWCADSATTGSADPRAEDFKRVNVHITWAVNHSQGSLDQLATFSASGAAVGPVVSELTITSPTVSSQTAPTITVNPSNGLVTLRGVSIGAGDMRFTVNGAEQSGATNAGGGAWTFNWNITTLKDGVYTVGAVALDPLGTRGEPRTVQVTLSRSAPAPITGLTGGYNYATIGGAKTLILEGAWDANPEGNLIGYEVLRGSTVVCPTSLATTCADVAPALTGSTTYSFKTWYRDGAGAAQFVVTSLAVPAPTIANIASQYHLTYDSSVPAGVNTGTSCRGTTGSGTKFDMRSTTPAFTARTSGTGWVSGCLAPFPAGVSMSASSMTVASKWINTAGSDCTGMPAYLYLNGATLIAGTGINGGGALSQISRNSSTASPASSSATFNTSARSFAAGDQLSFHTPASTWSGCSGVSMYFNSSTQNSSVTLPLTGGGSANLAYPAAPTGLATAANADGSTTLTWTAPGGTPAPDFYRIYRDGVEFTNRYDTAGNTGAATITWTDSVTGGVAHTYRVTTASATLVESSLAGPVVQ